LGHYDIPPSQQFSVGFTFRTTATQGKKIFALLVATALLHERGRKKWHKVLEKSSAKFPLKVQTEHLKQNIEKHLVDVAKTKSSAIKLKLSDSTSKLNL